MKSEKENAASIHSKPNIEHRTEVWIEKWIARPIRLFCHFFLHKILLIHGLSRKIILIVLFNEFHFERNPIAWFEFQTKILRNDEVNA